MARRKSTKKQSKGKIIAELVGILIVVVVALLNGSTLGEIATKLFNHSLDYVYNTDDTISGSDTGSFASGVSTQGKSDIAIKERLKIHYIDVGQGDSILLQTNNAAILIDGGTGSSAEKLVAYLNNQNIVSLDYVIATHPHEDHIGGLDDVIKSVSTIKKVWMPEKSADTKAFTNLAKAISNKGIDVEQPEAGTRINLDGMDITVLAPNNEEYESLNDYSIVIKVTYGNNAFIFTGDAEEVSEKEILQKNFDLSADVLKVGHHGSSSSTSTDFLNEVNPQYAIISLGEGNDYGHPHTETLESLSKSGIVVYRTDRNGSIVITSDGNNLSFEVEKGSQMGYTDTSKDSHFDK